MTNREKIDLFKFNVDLCSAFYLRNNNVKIQVLPNSSFSYLAGTKKIGKNSFRIKFNPTRLKTKVQILHVVLHELGHIEHWVDKNDFLIISEYLAESWALLIAKQFYIHHYQEMVDRTRNNVQVIKSLVHKIGYYEALRSIGEWKDG